MGGTSVRREALRANMWRHRFPDVVFPACLTRAIFRASSRKETRRVAGGTHVKRSAPSSMWWVTVSRVLDTSPNSTSPMIPNRWSTSTPRPMSTLSAARCTGNSHSTSAATAANEEPGPALFMAVGIGRFLPAPTAVRRPQQAAAEHAAASRPFGNKCRGQKACGSSRVHDD